MRATDIHALRSLLQSIVGWTELGDPQKVMRAVRDMDNILGREHRGAMSVGRQIFYLDDVHTLTLEADDPDPLRLSVDKHGVTDTIVLPCHVARNVAGLLLAYCDSISLRNKRV